MLLTVLLLLSVLTVQGSGCDDFMKATVRNLQVSINREKTTGFLYLIPAVLDNVQVASTSVSKNYVVSHYFNDSAVCNEPCCVFSDAVFLSNSWIKLLQHLNRVHLKYRFISELTYTLDMIAEEKFQEAPDLTAFPSVQSTPETLLSFTSSFFQDGSNWIVLLESITASSPIPNQDDLDSEEVENIKSSEQVDEPIIEGETGKRQFDHGTTSGYIELYVPGFSQWTLSFLWIATCADLI